jgi:hypothetical protein
LIKFADKEYSKHDLDAQFWHSMAQFPGIVIKVCTRRRERTLSALWTTIFLESDSDIQVVMGLDIVELLELLQPLRVVA